MPRASPMEPMSSEVGHLGEDNDTMGTNIIEPRAQPVLHGEEHQPVLGEDDHQPVLYLLLSIIFYHMDFTLMNMYTFIMN